MRPSGGRESIAEHATRSLPRVVLAIAFVWLCGCAALGPSAARDWPPTLPSLTFFEAAYAAGVENHEYQTLDEYLYWVRAFYTGTALYPRGWNAISRDVLAEIDDSARAAALSTTLYRLGRDMAAEWSKSGRVNRVKNGHLAVWGVAAERAVEEGSIEETLASIEADVAALLAREVDPGAIRASRYHEPDPDDVFAF